MSNYTPTGNISTISEINAELEKIANSIADKVDRSPDLSQANQMEVELDMNSNRIINLADGENPSDAVTKRQLDSTTATITVSSIDNIDAYVGTTPTTAQDLEAASDAVETLLFGGTSLVIENDVVIDSNAVARVWDLQGSTITLSNNAQITIQKDNFSIINGVIDGGLKETFITSATSSSPTSFAVDNPSAFEVGDHISCSWSNGYLPNSTSISQLPGGVLNTLSNISSNTYTMANAVSSTSGTDGATTNILAENTRLFNARFDKSTIKFQGSGKYLIQNMVFQNCSNAYYIDLEDTTEQAQILLSNNKFNSIVLDAFKFQCSAVLFDNCFCASPRDIGKQNIVWANNTKRGYLGIRNSEFYNGTRDSILFGFATGSTMYIPNTYLENSTFDGTSSTDDYTPNQIYNYSNSLNFLSFFDEQISPSGTAQKVEVGKLTAINSEFKAFTRAIWGTTFDGSNFIVSGITFNQDKVLFENCLVDGTPVDIRSAGGTTNIESIVVDNCEVRFSGGINTFFFQGVREYNIRNSLVKDNYPDTGGLQQTIAAAPNDFITADVKRNQILNNTSTGKNYICVAGQSTNYTARVSDSVKLSDTNEFLEIEASVFNGVWENTIINNRLLFSGNDIFWNNARFNKVATGITNKPTISNFQQGKLFGSAVLIGQDITDSGIIDIEDWMAFNINPDNKTDNDIPIITFYIDDSNCVIEYGGNEATDVGGEGDYHYKLVGLRSDPSVGDTSPLNYRGAFMYNPPERSVVEFSRDRTLKQIISSQAVTIDSGTVSTNTVTTSAIPSAQVPNLGDWISFNNSGSSETYFHEIRAVSGSAGAYTLTVRPALNASVTSTTNSQLIKHDWLYGAPLNSVEVLRTSGTQNFTASGWRDITFSSEVKNDIEYCSTDLVTGKVTLPRGKYTFKAQASFLHDSGASAVTSLRTTTRLVSDNSSFTPLYSSSDTDRSDDGTSSSGVLTTHNTLSGTFEINNEDIIGLEVYASADTDIDTSDGNNPSAILEFTKIG